MALFFRKQATISVADYYEAKWLALESFYDYLHDGADDALALARFLDDVRPTGGFEDMVMLLTLAAWCYQFGHGLSPEMGTAVEKALAQYDDKPTPKIRQSLGKDEVEDLDKLYQQAQLAWQLGREREDKRFY